MMQKYRDFEAKYLGGNCDALAIALAHYSSDPIRAIYPVHVKADGSKHVDSDFLHAYVFADGVAWDAKGMREEIHVLGDFDLLLQSLMLGDDVRMEVQFKDYSDAEDFIFESGCNPDMDRAASALRSAILPLELHSSICEMVLRQLSCATG